jgi:hypothetical protein
VQDQIDARECTQRFGSDQAVGIRDEANQHDFNIVSRRAPRLPPSGRSSLARRLLYPPIPQLSGSLSVFS